MRKEPLPIELKEDTAGVWLLIGSIFTGGQAIFGPFAPDDPRIERLAAMIYGSSLA